MHIYTVAKSINDKTNVHVCKHEIFQYNTKKVTGGAMSRKSIGISNDRYLKIERAAVDITAKTGKVTKWSEIVNFLIDEYLQEAKLDMISKDDKEKK